MVHGEKLLDSSNMLTLNSSDPFASKHGQSGMCGKSAGVASGSSSSSCKTSTPVPQQQASFGATATKTGQSQQQQYGSWGPVFKNKDHFASLHFC